MAGPLDNRVGSGGSVQARHRLQLVGDDRPVPAKRPISVLYVEDDGDDAYLLAHQMGALASFAVDFAHADTPASAKAMIERHQFDVVICDFWLGEETTIPLIDELRNVAPGCPIVLVSSLENEDIELIGRRAGAAGFVAKADLDAPVIDRIFSTLLSRDACDQPAGNDGVRTWLKALMTSLDRARARRTAAAEAASTRSTEEAILADILSGDGETRREILDRLAGLERATRRGAGTPTRFDAVGYLTDAVNQLIARAPAGATVRYVGPSLPILMETSPTLFSDLLQGFFAEALELLLVGVSIEIQPTVRDGSLEVLVTAMTPPRGATEAERDETAARVRAAAEARRFLVETLARATGGWATFGGAITAACGPVGRLEVPLRVSRALSDLTESYSR